MTRFDSPAVLTVSFNYVLLRAKRQGKTQDNSFMATKTGRQLMRRAVPILLMTNLLKVRDVLGGVPPPRKSVWTTLHCNSYSFPLPDMQHWALGEDLLCSGHLDSVAVSHLPKQQAVSSCQGCCPTTFIAGRMEVEALGFHG